MGDDKHLEQTRTLPSQGPNTEPSRSEPPSRSLTRGSTIGRYVVLEPLGEGGMGVVYTAYDPELDRKVAIKLLRPGREYRRDEDGQRLLREAQAMARLTHPNVITVHDVGQHWDMVFIAMEFVRGQTWSAWQKAETRSLEEILEVARGAARGLRAAHDAGLVHRDFKPDNVMLGDDGRVRVMDFGLAHMEDELEEIDITQPSEIDGAESTGARSVRLTEAGTVIGTPAYMAPEQFLGQPTDARTDQFGFCVSVFEAVYGQRPFAGKSALTIGAEVMAGNVEVPPSDDVPTWIRDLLLRGLAVSPADRWPSMADVERALAHDEAPTRRRGWLLGLALIPVAAWAATASPDAEEQPSVCTGAHEELSSVWSPERAAEIRRAFAVSEFPFAQDAGTHVVARLDAYAAEWEAGHTEACEATRVRGEQSAELLDARMRCLDNRRRSLGSLVETLVDADDDVVAKGSDVAAQLPSVARCAEVDYVTATVEPPDDHQLADAVSVLQNRLMGIEALESAGKYAKGWAMVEAVEQDAASLDYPPLHAQVALRKGMLGLRTRHYDEAEAAFRTAFFDARRVGDDETRTRAAVFLVRTLGLFKHDHEGGLEWAQHAQAEVDRFGDPRLRGDLLNHVGVIRHDQGDFEQAIALHSEALELRRTTLGDDHPDCGRSLMELGLSFHESGKWEEGIRNIEASVVVMRDAFGEAHPLVAKVYGNFAATSANSGRWSDATEYFERSADVWTRARGPQSIDAAAAFVNSAMTAHRGENHAREVTMFERGIAAYQRIDGAEAAAEAALARVNLAISRMDDGDVEQGVRELAALAMDLEDRDADERPYTYTWLGIGYGRLGRHDDATKPLLRAMELHTAEGTQGPELGRTLFALGRNFEARGKRDDARDHVQRALETLPPPPPEGHDGWGGKRAQWSKWLEAHPPAS